MAFFTNTGLPIEILECYRGHERDGGFILVKAKQIGTYPDGKGADSIGKILNVDDPIAKGWTCCAYLYSDKGIDDDKFENVPDGKPDDPAAIMHYYWPARFDKEGHWISRQKYKRMQRAAHKAE